MVTMIKKEGISVRTAVLRTDKSVKKEKLHARQGMSMYDTKTRLFMVVMLFLIFTYSLSIVGLFTFDAYAADEPDIQGMAEKILTFLFKSVGVVVVLVGLGYIAQQVSSGNMAQIPGGILAMAIGLIFYVLGGQVSTLIGAFNGDATLGGVLKQFLSNLSGKKGMMAGVVGVGVAAALAMNSADQFANNPIAVGLKSLAIGAVAGIIVYAVFSLYDQLSMGNDVNLKFDSGSGS